MAKIQILKKSIRGRAVCSKCGRDILPGEKYNKAVPFRREPIIRCLNCGLKSYETSGSKYVRWAGNLVNNWERMYFIDETVVENIMSDVESYKDDIEYNLFNLPEQFQDDNILRERLDGLEECLSELESIDTNFYSDLDEEDDSYDNELKANENGLITDINTALSNLLVR